MFSLHDPHRMKENLFLLKKVKEDGLRKLMCNFYFKD